MMFCLKNKKWIYMIVFLLNFGLILGCSPKKDTVSELPIVEENRLYNSHCANCHGGNLEGSYGPSLQSIGKKYSKNQLLEIMKKGKGSMPSQDYISREDQEKLAFWLSSHK